jgi:3-hydroxyisobutyrate dehydrogenase-like beta-hydroxyacid dehydrogenase
MKVGFIGLGRMGQAMAHRLLAAGHSVAVFNRTPEKLKALTAAGATAASSIAEAARYGEAVLTMLADDAALDDVARQKDGLIESLPKDRIHLCAGTHCVALTQALNAAHA